MAYAEEEPSSRSESKLCWERGKAREEKEEDGTNWRPRDKEEERRGWKSKEEQYRNGEIAESEKKTSLFRLKM